MFSLQKFAGMKNLKLDSNHFQFFLNDFPISKAKNKVVGVKSTIIKPGAYIAPEISSNLCKCCKDSRM